jgi:hypothetical protein
VFVHVTSVSDASVFNDGEAAIVRSCQSPGECHCSAKCDGAQSPGSIEISHKAEAIKRGQAFLKLNILLVGYYGSVTEPDDHPTNPAGQLFTGNIQSRRDIGIGVPKNNKFNAGLIEGSFGRAVVNADEIGGNALALPDVGGQPNMLDAYLGTVSGEEFGAILARHVTAARSVAEKQFTQPRDNAAGLNLF